MGKEISKGDAFCMNIYHEYSAEEVDKYAPPAVQNAWRYGATLYLKYKKEVDKKHKDFVL